MAASGLALHRVPKPCAGPSSLASAQALEPSPRALAFTAMRTQPVGAAMSNFFLGIAVVVLGLLAMMQGFEACLECGLRLP